jgi:hypothetical protein
MYDDFSVCCIFIHCRLVSASITAASSSSVFTSLLTSNCLTTNSYSSNCCLKTLAQSYQRVRVTLWLAVYCQSVRLGGKSLQTHNQNFYFSNTCCYSPYVTSSLTRGWVCHSLLLVLASAVVHRSESHRTHDHILLSQTWDSPNMKGLVPLFVGSRNRVAQLPRLWVQSQSHIATDGQSITMWLWLFAAVPCSVVSAQTAQETPFPIVLFFHHVAIAQTA